MLGLRSCTYIRQHLTTAHKTKYLRELGKASVCKERDVAENLVAEVRLWGVERLAVVADVLRGVEHAESEAFDTHKKKREMAWDECCLTRSGGPCP